MKIQPEQVRCVLLRRVGLIVAEAVPVAVQAPVLTVLQSTAGAWIAPVWNDSHIYRAVCAGKITENSTNLALIVTLPMFFIMQNCYQFMQFSSGKLSTFAARALALVPVFCKHVLNKQK
ncbi:hypothetical protein HBA94_01760 [Ochrobactrum sp. GRS2]|nr:hypothetical protein [Ochrobactrum sp. GRS2]